MHPGDDEQPTALDRRAERAAHDRELAGTPSERRRATARLVGTGGAAFVEGALRGYLIQAAAFFAVITGVAAGIGGTDGARVAGIAVGVVVLAFVLWIAWRKRGPLEQYLAVLLAFVVLAVTLVLVFAGH